MAIDSVGLAAGTANAPINPSQGSQQPDRVEASQNEERARKQTTEGDGDSVQISDAARQAANVGEGVDATGGDDVRPDRVQQAREFLQNKLYNDQGVLDQTAENIQPFITTL